jgi:hypothetical protein
MWQDVIVEETREVRRQIVSECGEDVQLFFNLLRAREQQHVHDVLSRERGCSEAKAIKAGR